MHAGPAQMAHLCKVDGGQMHQHSKHRISFIEELAQKLVPSHAGQCKPNCPSLKTCCSDVVKPKRSHTHVTILDPSVLNHWFQQRPQTTAAIVDKRADVLKTNKHMYNNDVPRTAPNINHPLAKSCATHSTRIIFNSHRG